MPRTIALDGEFSKNRVGFFNGFLLETIYSPRVTLTVWSRGRETVTTGNPRNNNEIINRNRTGVPGAIRAEKKKYIKSQNVS